MEQPLVSVICLCYNHGRFIKEAIESVITQTYTNLQVIVVDDASTDESVAEILKLKDQHPVLDLILLQKNIGNCTAFNVAFKLAQGKYIIDFATDDVMMPTRIEKQVNFFETQAENVGVVFTDATYIDEKGEFLRNHFEYLFKKRLISNIPTGDVYRNVVSTYFIPGPAMMTKRTVLVTLAGYDEKLAYEDFDFWARSAREFKYGFLNERLTHIRKLSQSMSTGLYLPGDKQLHSTYLVCKKIQQLNRDEGDEDALIKRLRYEFRQSVFSGNFTEGHLFFNLLKELGSVSLPYQILFYISRKRVPLTWLRNLYHKIRYS